MKKGILLLVALGLATWSLAQDTESSGRTVKKVTVVKKWVDEDGVERTETIIREAEDLPAHQAWLTEPAESPGTHNEITKEVEIRMGDEPEEKQVRMRIREDFPAAWEHLEEDVRENWPVWEEKLRDAAVELENLTLRMTEQAFLGVVTSASDAGAVIDEVVENSAAEKAGLQSGDVLLRIGQNEVKNHNDIARVLREHKPGDAVALTFLRDGKEQNAEATLGQREIRMARQWKEMPCKDFYMVPHMKKEAADPTAFLGIVMEPHEDGVRITEVVRQSPARAVGLREGDILYRIDRTSLTTPEEVSGFIQDKKEGDQVTLQIRRDGKKMEVPVVLGSKGADCCLPVICPPGCCEKIVRKEKSVKKQAEAEMMEEEARKKASQPGNLQLQDLRIFPNPTNSTVRVAFRLPSEESFTIRLMDTQGKVMMTQEITGTDTYDEDIDLRDMPAGNYTLFIDQSGQYLSRTIIRNQ